MKDLNETLKETLAPGSVLIVGVGNESKGDDGAGPVCARRLMNRVSATVIDAGVSPENYLEKIVEAAPHTILIIDAADFGGSPGNIQLFDADKITAGGLSTHALSLHMTQQYVAERLPETRICLLAIQPATLEGNELSPPVRAACDAIEHLFRGQLPLLKR